MVKREGAEGEGGGGEVGGCRGRVRLRERVWRVDK